MQKRMVSVRFPGADYEIRVLGGQVRPLRDFYHGLLRLNWPATLGLFTAGYLFINAVFAELFVAVGGIANARPGMFVDAFFFSVQTMGTIGYGSMYPTSLLSNWLVVVESVMSLLFTALGTGLIFAKFSRPTARIVFTQHVVVCPVNGVQTLMFRLGNERGNAIVDAQFRAVLTRTEHTEEGALFYRSYDLKLVRERALQLNRSFSISHRIDEHSPFFGQSSESIITQEYELDVIVVGLDDAALQTVHAAHKYFARDILWNTRLADVLSDAPDGAMVLDLRKFHDVVRLD
jgi:inward rectifier potassium channel